MSTPVHRKLPPFIELKVLFAWLLPCCARFDFYKHTTPLLKFYREKMRMFPLFFSVVAGWTATTEKYFCEAPQALRSQSGGFANAIWFADAGEPG
jgi:hypothetical protein